MKNIFDIAGAVIISVGGAGFIIICLSTWLGRIWANRILAQSKAELSKIVSDYNRFSGRRFEMIQETWNALFSVIDELRIYQSGENDNLRIMHDLQTLSTYLTTIKKNSLYFNNEIADLLEEYLHAHHYLTSTANSQLKEAVQVEKVQDIMAEVVASAAQRDEILEKIKLKFRKELGF